MAPADTYAAGNSYLGLVRQASPTDQPLRKIIGKQMKTAQPTKA